MYFSNFNSVILKALSVFAITAFFFSSAFASNILTTVCLEDGSTETIFFSEEVSMVGATTDSSFPSFSGSFLTGFSGTVWAATGDIEGPVDGVGGRASMGTLATVTRPLVLIDYGLNIPCNATITDVNFNITRRNEDLDNIQDLEIRLRLPDYSLSATNMANGADWLESTAAWETVSYNDATWGETLTADMLNDPRFGIWVIVNKSENAEGARAVIDAIEIEVCYDIDGAPFESIEMAVVKGNTSCGEQNGQINIVAENGSGDFEYSIDNGVTWTTNSTFNSLAPGSYLVTVRNTDGTCQTATFNCLVGADNTILQPGDAVVTCDPFGTPVTLVIERIQPISTFYTAGFQGSDVSGLIEPSPHEYTTTQLGGEVWSTTIDPDLNIYTGTTSLYSPNTNSNTIISVIDAMSGVASAIGTLPGDKGIAGIEYDTACDQLFAANLEDGVIYRVDPVSGATLSTFDPGAPDSGAVGYEPLGERILGLAYNPVEQRLYYSVWSNDLIDNGMRNTVRSIAIDPTTCDFLPATDVLEITIPFLSEACGDIDDTYSMPVSDIEFNSTGTTLLLAESGINSANFVKTAHKARILEYDGSTGGWAIDNAPNAANPNGCKYGIGTYQEQNNSRGGVDFANAGFDQDGCLTGVDDFFVTTVDGAFGVNCVESCVYGLQYTPTSGGGPFQSVGLDIDRDNNSQLKSVYGDVDMVPGCLISDPIACQEYDLAIDITVTTPPQYNPGGTVTYEVTVTNEGDIAASNVDVDLVPETGLVFTGSTADANVTDNGNETFQVSSLPSGGTQVIEVTYQIAPTFTGTDLDLVSIITADDGDDIDSDPATDQTVDEDGDGDGFDDDEDIVNIPVIILDYDLSLTKTLTSAGPFNQGTTVTFDIVVSNDGDLPAAGIVVTENSPADLIFQSMTADANLTDNGNETFTIAALAVGATQTIEVTYQIDPNFAGGSISNIALITADDGDDIDSNPDDDETVDEDGDGNPFDDDEDEAIIPTTILEYDLALDIVLTTPGPHNPGDVVTYEVTIENQGDLDAANIDFDLNPDLGLTYQGSTAAPNVTDNGNETFQVGSIPVGGMQVIEITYQIDPTFTGTDLDIISVITADDGDDRDSDPATDQTVDEDGDGDGYDDDEDIAALPVTILDYDLSLTKTLTSAGPFNQGSTVTFDIVVSNDGDLPAAGIVVTENSPSDLIFQSMTADANLTDNGNETFTIAALAVGATQTIEVTYQIDPNFDGGSISNIALITADDGDDIDSNPDDDETVDEDGDGDPFDDDEDEATIPTTILEYDLALEIVLTTAGPHNPGDVVTYQVTIENQGDLDAANIDFDLNPDFGLNYQGSTVDPNVTDNGNETFQVGSIPVGGMQVIEITYQIDPTFTGTDLDIISVITTDDGDDRDSDPATDQTVDEDGDGDGYDDDEDIAALPVTILDYDLSLTKTLASVGPFNQGSFVTFDIVVSNDGDLPASGIEVTENSPASLIYQSIATDANVTDNGNQTFTIGSIAVGATQTISVTYQIDPDFMGGSISNIALITEDDGDDIDSDPNDDETVDEDGDGDPFDDDEDEATIPTTILEYDLALEIVLTTVGPHNPGDVVTYEITIENQGDLDASNIDIANNPELGLVFQGSTTDPNVTDNGNETFEIASLPVGGMQVIEVAYQIDPTFTGSDLEIISIITADDGDDRDSDPATDQTVDEDGDGNGYDDDEDIAALPVTILDYDLALTKTLTTVGQIVKGDVISFEIVVTNQGELPANNVVVTDESGASLLYQSITADANVADNGNETFTVSTLAVGASQTIEVFYQVDPNFAGTALTNLALITADDGDDIDSDPADDETVDEDGNGDPFDDDEDDEDVVVTILDYDLSLTKTVVGDGPFGIGTEISFIITVLNEGDAFASNIEVTDDAPAAMIYNGSTPNGNVTDIGNGTFRIISLPPGISQAIELSYTIDPDFTGVSLSNLALITEDDGDDIDSDPDGDETVDENGDGDPLDDDEDTTEFEISRETLLGDFVWEDINGDGVQDPNEPGIEGIEVVVRTPEGVIVSTQFTDPSGGYMFEDLAPGEYFIEFVPPFGLMATFPNTSNNDNTDSDIDNSNGLFTTPIFNLGGGEQNLSFDAGFYQCVPVGELVWFDTNENDIWDTVENGINGMRVNIHRRQTDGDYILWNYTFTGPKPGTPSDDGYYKFCVPPGDYYLEFISPPVGLVNAQANVGNNDEIDSDVTGANGAGTTNTFTLTSGQEVCNIGAGYYPMGTIGDFVFMDSNQNGLRDPNETGLANVYIEAFNVEGDVVSSTISNIEGQYRMEYLEQEDVYLKFYSGTAYASTVPNNGDENFDSDIDHSNGPMTTPYFNITAGEHRAAVDAGFIFGVVAADWLSIDGINKDNHNEISWQVGAQVNVSHYEVERSLDLINNFEVIGTQFADLSSLSGTMYEFNDFDLVENTTLYYRVKMVDNNGDSNYSEVIAIEVGAIDRSKTQARVYPNPMVDEFTLELSSAKVDGELSYEIFNGNGKVAISNTILSDNLSVGKHMYQIDVTSLSEGIYTLKVNTGTSTTYKKIIVIK